MRSIGTAWPPLPAGLWPTKTPPEIGHNARLRFGAGQAGGLADRGGGA